MKASGSHQDERVAADEETIDVCLEQGTNLAITLSPDCRFIAMDLQGILWVLAIEGGDARRLTDDLGDIAWPRWSPDGQQIVFQSYRTGNFQLWSIRPDGSALQQLTHGEFDHREPCFSPDGTELAFASDRSGRFAIYAMDLANGSVRTVASESAELSEPAWSPDGTRIAFVRDGQIAVAPAQASAQKSSVTTAFVPMPGQVGAKLSVDDPQKALPTHAHGAAGSALNGRTEDLQTADLKAAPTWTPDGRSVIYRGLSGKHRDWRTSCLYIDNVALTPDDEEVFPLPAAFLNDDIFLYTAQGEIRQRSLSRGFIGSIPFRAQVSVKRHAYTRRWRDYESEAPRPVKGISFPVLSPDGGRVAFGALNQLWLLTLTDPKPKRLTDDGYAMIWPAFSPDGQQLAYVTDRGGNMDIWLRDLTAPDGLQAGRPLDRQLTHASHALKQCAWSPDGRWLACGSSDGVVYLVNVQTGELTRTFHQTVWSGRPCWSPDGTHLTLAAVKPYSARYREARNLILVYDIARSQTRYYPPSPQGALDVRNVNGPIWIAGGGAQQGARSRLLFTMRGELHAMGMDAAHCPVGPAIRINEALSDAISADADGKTVLYLSNGALHLLNLASAVSMRLPLDMTWQVHRPAGRTVIRAGRMWDGASSCVVEDVDIVIERGRIVSVSPHDAMRFAGGSHEREEADEEAHDEPNKGSAQTRFIDATQQTVMPGMIDMHTHREMGNQLGARDPRIFLSFGITTTRGLSDNPYLALENKESVDAGERVGPRHFGTGDAFDGTRTFWDGMRPIADAAQLDRELERAARLDYDLIKCYVRLPPDLQARATLGAHKLGIPITSHYLFPAVAFGGDGYEHMGETSRFGYSRTGSALGNMYGDVLALSAAAQCYRTPTLFGLEGLLGDTPALINEDRRVAALFTQTDRAALQRSAAAGPSQHHPSVERQVQAIIRMLNAGVKVVTGSDYPMVVPAISMHLNLRAMVRYGMRPIDALKTATGAPGAALYPDLGKIVPGALADLVFIDGDPTVKIEDAANVDGVMVGGAYHSVASLIAPFEDLAKRSVTTTSSAARMTEAMRGALAQRMNRQLGQNQIPPAIQGENTSASEYWWHDPRWIECVLASCCGMIEPIYFPNVDGEAQRSSELGMGMGLWRSVYREALR